MNGYIDRLTRIHRQRNKKTGKETEKYRKTDSKKKERGTQATRMTDGLEGRQTDRQTEKEKSIWAGQQVDRPTDKQTDGQIDRQTDRQTYACFLPCSIPTFCSCYSLERWRTISVLVDLWHSRCICACDT